MHETHAFVMAWNDDGSNALCAEGACESPGTCTHMPHRFELVCASGWLTPQLPPIRRTTHPVEE